MAASQKRDFTAAAPLLWAYDALAAFTRESKWRTALLQQLNPQESDVIADVGCGTASFLILLGRQVKRARLIGIDPDGDILKRARSKLRTTSDNDILFERARRVPRYELCGIVVLTRRLASKQLAAYLSRGRLAAAARFLSPCVTGQAIKCLGAF